MSKQDYDVVVVGTGAAGAMAALKAADLGLRVLMVEKSHQFGGTSATSGGLMWVPNNGLTDIEDSREAALKYLEQIMKGPVRREKVEAYLDTGPEMIRFLQQKGVELFADDEYPDYHSEVTGARTGRAVGSPAMDGVKLLGDDFLFLRDQFDRFKLFGRVAFDLQEMYVLGVRKPGWFSTMFKGLLRYWFDWPLRFKTRRDRKLTIGNALMAQLWRAINDTKSVDLWLNTGLKQLTTDDQGRVAGVVVSRHGKDYPVEAGHGVVIAAGGFEANQELRDKYWKVKTDVTWSLAPKNQNTGDALLAAQELGAATEFMDEGWWNTTMRMPTQVANLEETHITVFDIARPHSFCVNRQGKRFANESGPYDNFGQAQIQDYKESGGSIPCWLVFDSQFRSKFTAGGIDPTPLLPDKKIPPHWWGQYIYKAENLADLAQQIDIDADGLQETAAQMNRYASSGVDEQFRRGSASYDQIWGDPRVEPNSCLGSIDKPPYYAVPLYLGDIGTKGGLKTDVHARVLDAQDEPIRGLYAAGNAAGSPYGYCYPGAGGTIGPATIYGYRAACFIGDTAGKD